VTGGEHADSASVRGAPRLGWSELWRAALCFAIAVTIAHSPVVFLGRSLVASEQLNPLDDRPTVVKTGVNFLPLQEWHERGIPPWVNIHDPGSAWWQAEPGQQFFRNALRSGQFPFWDPYTGAGAPAYANMTQSFFFPPQIVLCLAGATSIQKNVYILLFFWACGFGTYWLLRQHGVTCLGSATGGLTFLFSGAAQQIGPITFMAHVVVCMPFLIIATRWFVDQPSWSRTAGLAAVYAVASLASFPPILIAAFGLTVVYCGVAVISKPRAARLLLVSRYLAAAALSFGMVAVYYVPTIFAIREAVHARDRYSNAGLESLPLRGLLDLLSPTAGGGTLVYTEAIIPPTGAHLFYTGITALFLATLAFVRCAPARTLVAASGVYAAVILLKVFGVPPVQWLGLLPVLRSIHFSHYFGIALTFIVAILAGVGLDVLLLGRAKLRRVAFTIALVAAALAATWWYVFSLGALERAQAWRWIADYQLLVLFALVAVAAALIINVSRFGEQRRYIGAALLMALIFVEGVVNATYPRQKRWDAFAHPPAHVAFLQQTETRSRGFVAAALTANVGSAFGIHELDSLYTFFSSRMQELYVHYTRSTQPIFMREAAVLPPEPVLDAAGIGWLLINKGLTQMLQNARARSHALIYGDDFAQIFRRESGRRFFFSSHYEVVAPDVALGKLASLESGKILLEQEAAFASTANAADDPVPAVVAEKLNGSEFRFRAPRAGFLYVADVWNPGWSAQVNGRRAPILRANYAFRAVPVAAGDVRVQFSYLPVGFIAGAVISVVCVLLAIGLAVFERWRTARIETDHAQISGRVDAAGA
jgi:hypothetical protein